MLSLLRNRRHIPSVTDNIDVSILLLQKNPKTTFFFILVQISWKIRKISLLLSKKRNQLDAFFSTFSSIYSYGMESSFMNCLPTLHKRKKGRIEYPSESWPVSNFTDLSDKTFTKFQSSNFWSLQSRFHFHNKHSSPWIRSKVKRYRGMGWRGTLMNNSSLPS